MADQDSQWSFILSHGLVKVGLQHALLSALLRFTLYHLPFTLYPLPFTLYGMLLATGLGCLGSTYCTAGSSLEHLNILALSQTESQTVSLTEHARQTSRHTNQPWLPR